MSGSLARGPFYFGARSLRVRATLHPELVRVVDPVVEKLDLALVRGVRTKARQRIYVDGGWSTTLNSRHLPGGAWDPPEDCEYPELSYAFDFGVYIAGVGTVFREKELAFAAGVIMDTAFDLNVALRWGGDWDSDGDQEEHDFWDAAHVELDRRYYR